MSYTTPENQATTAILDAYDNAWTETNRHIERERSAAKTRAEIDAIDQLRTDAYASHQAMISAALYALAEARIARIPGYER